jgi:hypothetical protein
MRPRRRSGRPAARAFPSHSSDRGSFTAELAAGLPALILLLLVGLAAVQAATTKAQCVDAARDVALAAARGEVGEPAARRAGPEGATVSLTVHHDTVIATVRAPVRAFGVPIGPMTIHATAVAALEPGVPSPMD